MANYPIELGPEQLYAVCEPNDLPFETTETLPEIEGTVGQERALSALHFGLDVEADGYNLFVAGGPGSGRSTTVMAELESLTRQQPVPDDWCYVHNFQDAYRPRVLRLPTGMGPRFANDLDDFIERCKAEIPRAFDSEPYQQRRQQILTETERRHAALIEALEKEANSRGFTVRFGPAGAMTIPVVEGKLIGAEEFQGLPEPVRQGIRERGEAVQEQVNATLRQLHEAQHRASEQFHELDRQTVLFAVGHLIEDFITKYHGCQPVVAHLEAVRRDIVDHLDLFRSGSEPRPGGPPGTRDDPLGRYRANVLVSRDGSTGAPVVFERNPTYYNLLGRIEYRPAFGTMSTDFRMIKAGALHRANGGYLVLQARDVLLNPMAWEALKRTLDSGQLVIENMWEMVTPIPTLTVRPEPIPVKVKVVLIGTPVAHDLLSLFDEDFRKLFKVRADFDLEMDRSPDNVATYAQFIGTRVREDGLLHFDKTGVARVVEYGSRLLEHQQRLWTRFVDIGDLVSEASHVAKRAGSGYVTGEHVRQAIAQRDFRSSLARDKIQLAIREGVLDIGTEGSVVGRVNGLSVLQTSSYVFGVPSRISARVSPGGSGVVNVEREIEMSGKVHSKGVMILAGYLAGKYAQDAPLSLSASLTFEQLYNEVDGDSASSAELCALLSALADAPLDQGLAVTGSVNLNGQIQAVGGVQYKIEGFFDTCRGRGLTGRQGVIIPAANMPHLMLREDVVGAVRGGQFHVYAVSHVEEALELLTGLEAGVPGADGLYPEGTLNHRIQQRLHYFADRLSLYAGGGPGADRRGLPLQGDKNSPC